MCWGDIHTSVWRCVLWFSWYTHSLLSAPSPFDTKTNWELPVLVKWKTLSCLSSERSIFVHALICSLSLSHTHTHTQAHTHYSCSILGVSCTNNSYTCYTYTPRRRYIIFLSCVYNVFSPLFLCMLKRLGSLGMRLVRCTKSIIGCTYRLEVLALKGRDDGGSQWTYVSLMQMKGWSLQLENENSLTISGMVISPVNEFGEAALLITVW